LLYLPLDKLMQRGGADSAVPAQAVKPAEQGGLPASEFAPATRARELLLGREREAR